MLSKFKEEFSKHKLVIALGSVLLLSLIAYISRKRTSSSTSQKFQSYTSMTQGSSPNSLQQKRESWSKSFDLQLLTRTSFLQLLHSVNAKLKDSIVIPTQKSLKDQHRQQRRLLHKEGSDKYLKFLEAAITKETEATENIIKEVLQERNIPMEKFKGALELYRNDGEVLEVLEEVNFEASKGLVPNENIVDEVLRFEIESWKREKSVIKKYQVEDEVWEKWGVEVGDVHALARNCKKKKSLLLELRRLR